MSHVRLTVVEPALSETCLKWQRQSKVPPHGRCITSYDFSMQKVNVWFLYSIVVEDETYPLVSSPKEHFVGKKFDDDDEVQEEVMIWFKGLAAGSKT